MRSGSLLFVSLLFVLGCERAPVPAAAENTPEPELAEAPAQAEAEPVAEPAAEAAEETPNQFGAALSDREAVALAQITGDPESYAGQTVKTEGEITAVCQRMGCWMEMNDGEGPTVRVPMAGHSFFLPRDVSGRRARIEGEVALRQLPPGEAQHLAEEGAQATGSRLQITATGVELL